ncbi:MAG: SulP family inorganic anion transporter [Phycisphaerales bacterium]
MMSTLARPPQKKRAPGMATTFADPVWVHRAHALVPEASRSVWRGEPLVGLYAAFMVGLLSVFGGCGDDLGATGAMAVVMVSLVATHGKEYLFAAVVLTGVIQISVGLLRLGKYIRIVPHP